MEREKDQMKDCGPANVRTLDDIDDIDIYLGLRPHLYLASVANGSVQHRTNPYLPIQTLLQQQSGAWLFATNHEQSVTKASYSKGTLISTFDTIV